MARQTIFESIRLELSEMFNGVIADINYRTNFEKDIIYALRNEDVDSIITLVNSFNQKFPNNEVALRVKKLLDSSTRKALASQEVGDSTKHIEISNQVYRNFELSETKNKLVITTEDNINFETCKAAARLVAEDWHKEKDSVIFPFIVSKNKTISGRIVQTAGNQYGQILMSAVEKKDGTLNIRFIGESHPLNSEKFEIPMYSYQIVCNNTNKTGYQTYTLLSREYLPMEELRIDGMEIPVRDMLQIGNKGNLEINTTVIFVIDYSKIIKTINKDEFDTLISKYNTHEELYKLYYSILRQPPLFEKFLLAMQLCSKSSEGYPSHVGLFGPAGCGKSKILETLVGRFGEQRVLETSTIKGLVPNFGGNSPDPGHFIKCRRVCAVDEFLNMIIKSDKIEEMTQFNSLLTHAKGNSSSGKHKEGISAPPTATMWFVSNFVKGRINNFVELCNKISVPFLSRFILYNYTPQHIEYIRNREDELFVYLSKISKEKCRNVTISEILEDYSTDAITLIDYIKNVNAEVNQKQISEIYNEVKEIIPEDYNIMELYEGRGKKHILSIVDGVTKYNYIIQKRTGDIVALPEDYELAKDIWYMIVGSWSANPMKLPVKKRVDLLTEKEMAVFLTIKDSPGINASEIEYKLKFYPITILQRLLEWKLVNKIEIGNTKSYTVYDYVNLGDKQ